MNDRPLLALIDGHALAFRAFHALREAGLRASSGEPTYAVFGFTSILLTAIEAHHPRYMAVAFDVGRTFRDDLYADYKAGRGEPPDEFHQQLERIKQLVTAFNIPIYTAEGFEADDVIGTLACQATAQGVDTMILTGDTDTLQLVDDHVRVLLANPYGKKTTTTLYDEAQVRERYKGLAPAQLADLRGLKGDTSDNIPGVKGIGEAGAIALLNQFGTVENLYDHFDETPNRYKKPLEGQRDAALFSKKIATIVCDVPVALDVQSCELHDYDRAAVIALFQELEFGASLVKRLPAAGGGMEMADLPQTTNDQRPTTNGESELAPPATPDPRSSDAAQQLAMFDLPPAQAGRATALTSMPGAAARATLGDYEAVRTEDDLRRVLAALEAAPGFAFDTEGMGLRPLQDEAVGISLAVEPGKAWYIPFGHREGEQLPRERVIQALRPFFADAARPKFAHNAKFDIEVLGVAGIEVNGVTFDTMLAAALLDKRKGLKDLAFYELKLPEPMTNIEELIGKGKSQISFADVPIEQALPYAAADADMTLRLVAALEPLLAAQPRVQQIFSKLEIPLLPVLVRMEQAGIGLDAPFLQALGRRMGQRLATLEQEIYAYNQAPFNINSGDQLSDLLFNKLGLPTEGLERTKTGRYSLTAGVLERLRDKDAQGVIGLILEHRQLTKLKSTYVDALPALVNPQTGRVHTSYSQIGAATGRLSCLPGGTLVNTQKGLVGIETVRPGDLIRTSHGPHRVVAWQATGEKPVVVLKLSNGIMLRCSPEHRIRSKGAWVEARDITIGAPVYMSFTEGMFGTQTAFHLHYASHYDTRKTPTLPTEWTVELAELVGYHMADGHIARSNYNSKPAKVVLSFGWYDDELVHHFAQIVKDVFGKEPTCRMTKSGPSVEISGVDIGGAIEQLGAGGKSKQIRVPPSLFNAPEPIVAAFLRGYFEGDGYAGFDAGIMVRSVSRAMLEGVQQLLTLFGIPSSIKNGSIDPRGYAPRYTLSIVGDRSKYVFYKRIGFLSERKQQACAAVISRSKVKSTAESFALPVEFDINTLKPAIYAAHRQPDGKTPQSVQVFASKLARGQQTMTLPRAEWVVDSLPDSVANRSAIFLHEVVSAQYYEVHVVAISHEPPVPMYDIAVDQVAQYIAQGIVVHNSNDPNLQNIPTRTDEGREIRRGFVAAPGCVFVAADYSQIELRVLAHVTQDPNLMRAFEEDQDIHAATASQLFNVPIDKVSKNQRRIAKCVAAGTLVNTEQGIIPIEQLGNAEVGDVAALRCVVAQEGHKQQVATGFYNGGVQPTIRITTERGYVLEATAQHRVRSLDPQGNYVWKRLDELVIGDYAAIARGGMLFGADRLFDISYTRRNDRKLRMPDRLTPAFARFLGYFVAEGNYRHSQMSSTVVISNTDPAVLADLRRLSRDIFGALPAEAVDRNGVVSMQWHCSRLVELLHWLGIEGGAANKRIPDVIMQASYESVTEFLRAFYEGDGSISNSFISAASKSYTLIHQLQVLLLNLGIICRIEHRDIPKHGRHYRLLVIGRDSRTKFAEHIGFITERKHSRLRQLVERQVTHELVVLPAQQERLLRMYPKTKRELKETIHTCIRTKSPAVALTYRRLASIIERFPEPEDADYQTLFEHQQRNLFYDRVASIEYGQSQVFDLVVPATNTYLANGFVSHNTTVFGVIYGISAFGLAARTDLSRTEAQALIDALFARFPGLRDYINATLEEGRAQGYVHSLFGRRRYVPELRVSGPRRQAAEREAINAPIQATAADIMKIAMIRVDEALRRRKLRTRMLLQVHDELIFEVPHAEVAEVVGLVCEQMEGAYPDLRVPLKVGVEQGPNWEEMEEVQT